MTPTLHSHCSHCGHPFVPDRGWPRRCQHCGRLTFRNPLPVAVVMVPVDSGLLVIRRGVAPRQGWLALPGGYVDLGESWQEAAVREVREETGLSLHESELQLMEVAKGSDDTLIVVGRAAPRATGHLPDFAPTPEVRQRLVVTEPTEMAFDLHTRLVREWLTRPAQSTSA